MSANALSARHKNGFYYLLTIALGLACFVGSASIAADSNEPQPSKTTLPADFDPSASKYTAHAPLMSDDERNQFYLKWGLIFVGGTGAAIALAIWLFTSGQKEETAVQTTDGGAQASAATSQASPSGSQASAAGSTSNTTKPEVKDSASPKVDESTVVKEESPASPASSISTEKVAGGSTQSEEKTESLASAADEGAGI